MDETLEEEEEDAASARDRAYINATIMGERCARCWCQCFFPFLAQRVLVIYLLIKVHCPISELKLGKLTRVVVLKCRSGVIYLLTKVHCQNI